MNIAAIIHTLNAGEFLAPCLDAIGDIPVYVFDQGSTDDTIAIARLRNNITLHRGCHPFSEGEAACRNWALDVVARPKFFTHFLPGLLCLKMVSLFLSRYTFTKSFRPLLETG